MNTVLLESQSKDDLDILLTLAKKLGMRTHKLTAQQVEDHLLANRIAEGMKTPIASRETIFRLLEP